MRQHMYNRRKFIGTVGAISVAGVAGCASSDGGSGDGGGQQTSTGDQGSESDSDSGGSGGTSQTWVMGTSREGSASFATGQAMQSVLEENSDRVQLSAQVSEGTVANVHQMASGTYDVSVGSDYLFADVHEGNGVFIEDPPAPEDIGMQGLSWLRGEYGLVQRSDDDIESWSDLAGRNVAYFPTGFSAAATNELVFEELGILNDINRRDLEINDHAAALESGRADAVGVMTFNNGDATTGAIQQIQQQNDIKSVPMTEEERGVISDLGVSTDQVTVSEEYIPDLSEDGYSAHLLGSTINFSSDLAEADVHHATEVWVDNYDQLSQSVDLMWDITQEENFLRNIRPEYPVHPGTESYIEDQGWSLE